MGNFFANDRRPAAKTSIALSLADGADSLKNIAKRASKLRWILQQRKRRHEKIDPNMSFDLPSETGNLHMLFLIFVEGLLGSEGN